MTTGKHFSEKTKGNVPSARPTTDLSPSHTGSLSLLPRGGWASSQCGKGVQQTNNTRGASKPHVLSPRASQRSPSARTQKPSNQKHFWQEYEGHQEANLDPACLAAWSLEGTEKEQESYAVNCQKAGKTQGLGLNQVPCEEVLAWCIHETCQTLSNGNKHGRRVRKS